MIPSHIRPTLAAYRAARAAWLAACEAEEAHYIEMLHTPDTGESQYSELCELSFATAHAFADLERTREAYVESTAASL